MRRTLLIVAMAWSLLAVPHAQTPAPASTHAGRISSVVVAADTRQPLRGASVTLEWRSGGFSTSLIALTDAKGRFTFVDLHADNVFALHASKAGYLAFGSVSPSSSGVREVVPTHRLSESEHRDDVTLALARAGAISGTVRDAIGDAVPFAAVELISSFSTGRGVLFLRPGAFATADDRGAYRFGGLGPGEYLVRLARQDDRSARLDSSDAMAVTLSGGEERAWVDVVAAPPPRSDPPPSLLAGVEDQPGNGSISGTLVAADTGRPIAHARIGLGGSGGTPPSSRSVMTDEDGRFHLANLPPWSSYLLGAHADGFVDGSYKEVAGGAAAPWSLIGVRSGQRVDGLTFRLQRVGAVSGIVRDESGDPVAGAAIALLGGTFGEAGQWTLVAKTASDERGFYRIRVPQPSEFLLSATPPPDSGGASVVSETRGPIPADLSELPGPFAPVFYPGTIVSREATRLYVAEGEQREAVDISLVRAPTIPVAGQVVFPDKSPSGWTDVYLDDPTAGGSHAVADRDGKFTLPAAASGAHTVVARCESRGLFASTTIVIEERQVWEQRSRRDSSQPAGGATVLTLPLHLGPRVTALVTLDSGLPPTPTTRVVTLAPRGSWNVEAPNLLGHAVHAAVDALGRVTFDSVFPGRYNFSVDASVSGASEVLVSEVSRGVDIADSGLDMGAEDVSDLALVFTDRAPRISGTLRDANGAAVPSAMVFAFPAGDDRADPNLPRYSSAFVSSDASFELPALRPGNYRVFGVTEPVDLRNPDVLKRFVEAGTLVTVGLGDHKTIELVAR
jgi:hypothetical protein